MLTMLRHAVSDLRARRLRKVSRNSAALADIPSTLYPYWKRTARFEFEGIPTDAFFFASASDSLLTFFDCVRRSGKPCALPSKAADSVWHAWERMAPESLASFCQRHFGRRIPHLESAAMPLRMDTALANCLVAARKRDGNNPEGPHLPTLFVADRKLGMPQGFAYSVVKGQVVFAHMDAAGRPERDAHLQAAMCAPALLAAGLIGGAEYQRYEERQRSTGTGCGSTGSSCGTACDSGGDGGSSDGSSCGGGCGGGGD